MSIFDRRLSPLHSKPLFSSNVDLSLMDDIHVELAEKTASSIASDAAKAASATTTQALADFLSSTGPEEFFEKPTAKRGSKLFSRLLKKPSNNVKPPVAEVRKKYVEIVPKYPQPRDDWNPSGLPTSSAAAKCAMEITKALSSQNLKAPSHQPPPYQAIKEMTHIEPRKPLKENVSPVPPVPLKNARRSSKISLGSSSAGDHHSTLRSPSPTIQASALEERRNEARRKAGRRSSRSHEMDLVEAALSQRMEARRKSFVSSNRSSSATTASDLIATEIANEHVKALQLTSVGQIDAVECNANRKRRTLTNSPLSTTSVPAAALARRRVRHAQVQTTDLPVSTHRGSAVSIETQTDGISEPSISISSSSDSDTTMVDRRKSSVLEDDDLTAELYHTIDMLQQQLAEEQRSKRRLVAAMRDSRDKNEILSALAYKKLRELWEEKCKWEGDCLELRGRLMELEGNDSSSM